MDAKVTILSDTAPYPRSDIKHSVMISIHRCQIRIEDQLFYINGGVISCLSCTRHRVAVYIAIDYPVQGRTERNIRFYELEETNRLKVPVSKNKPNIIETQQQVIKSRNGGIIGM